MESFFGELKRRRVVRVASVYGAAAFAVSEGADLVFPRLGLPDWTVTLVIVLGLAAFPVVLVLAWIFEWGEEGVVRTPGADSPAADDSAPGWLSVPSVVTVIAVLAVGVTSGWLAGRGSSRGDDGAFRSIAVLPFMDLSPDRDMEYFGDGMAEEILNALARLSDLKVAGRTSSFSFKDRGVGLDSIGTALGVGTVLEGSIRRSNTQLRVTAQLSRTDDQSQLWSQTFDRGFDEDVFDVQDEIATAVVEALRFELAGDDPLPVSDQRGTDDLGAYNAYLLGRFQWRTRTRAGVMGSMDAFEEAVRLDAAFARGYTGLADALIIAANFGWVSPHEAFPRARRAVENALTIDPRLAEAHTSLGAILAWYEWDYEESERAFRRALELDPNAPFARYWYAGILDLTNRPDAARVQLERALELDPLALQIRNGLGNHFYWVGDADAAIREYRENLRIDPGFHNARRWLALVYIDAGRYEQALAQYDSIPESFFIGGMAHRASALAGLGRVEEALAALESLPGPYTVVLADIARAYVKLGRPDEAFALLDEAVRVRPHPLQYIVFVPADDPIRADPRFAGIIRAIGLWEYWQ